MYLFLEHRDSGFLGKRDDQKVYIRAFMTLFFIGGIGNLAMLLTAVFSAKVPRNLTWMNFCVTWIIFSLSYTLLFIANQLHGEPAFPLCLTQAALIYGAPILPSFAGAALVVEIWLSMWQMLWSDAKSHSSRKWQKILLITVPYAMWLIIIVTVLGSGSAHPETVAFTGTDLYCQIATGVPGRVVASLVGVALLLASVLELSVLIVLYKNWRALKGLQRPGKVSNSMIARVAIFVCFSILAFSQVFVFLSRQFTVSNTVMSLMPVLAFVVFATQRDILRVWTFHSW